MNEIKTDLDVNEDGQVVATTRITRDDKHETTFVHLYARKTSKRFAERILVAQASKAEEEAAQIRDE